MIRLLLIVLLLMSIALVAVQLVRQVRHASVDWNGIAFAAGFVALAFYLRHVTDLG